MLKLSQISKVILLSVTLLAFSSVFANAQSTEDDYKRYNDKTNEAIDKYDNYKNDHLMNTSSTTYTDGNNTYTASGGNPDWQKAQNNLNKAKDDYTKASMEYNRCLANPPKGGCNDKFEEMNLAKADMAEKQDAFDKEQKQASKEANKATKLENKAKAKAEKALKKAKEKLKKCQKKAAKQAKKEAKGKNVKNKKDCEEELKNYEEARKNALALGIIVDTPEEIAENAADRCTKMIPEKFMKNGEVPCGTEEERNELRKEFNEFSTGLRNARNCVNALQAQTDAAEAECRRYSSMTSGDAQLKAQEACKKAEKLREKVESVEKTVSEAEKCVDDNKLQQTTSKIETTVEAGLVTKYNKDLTLLYKDRFKGGGDSDGEATLSSNFANEVGTDVFDAITRRSVAIIIAIKPIVYIFAGFGLIGFAWMAIFNKLSWKWFANIAMGLFLVANLGRLIEYFVGNDEVYYLDNWSSSEGAENGDAKRLSYAFHDTNYVEYTYSITYGPETFIENKSDGEGENNIVAEEFKADARGFCQGTSGSGWANFTSCVGDIVSTIKKAADTVHTVVNTAKDIKNRVETVKNTYKQMKATVENLMDGDTSVTDWVYGVGSLWNGVNTMVTTTTGGFASVTSGLSHISNNVQDMGKSTDQQDELNRRRSTGESTNRFDAFLNGQEWGPDGVENVDGQWAGKDNFVTKTGDFVNGVGNASNEFNTLFQQGVGAVGSTTYTIENTSMQDVFGFGSDKTLEDVRKEDVQKKKEEEQRRQQEEQQQQWQEQQQQQQEEYNQAHPEQVAQQEYNQAVNEVNQLENETKRLFNEYKEAERQAKEAQEKADAACSADPNGSLCSTLTTLANTAKDNAENKKALGEQANDKLVEARKDLKETETEYEQAKRDQAQLDFENAQATIDDINEQLANPDLTDQERQELQKQLDKAIEDQLDAAERQAQYAEEDAEPENNKPEVNEGETTTDSAVN